MHSSLQRYFALRIKNLFNYLHDFELSGAEVPLHDFRVELKRLKSIIKFLKTIYSKDKFKKTAFLLDSVFQHAGEIREYQLLLQWLNSHKLTQLAQTYFPEEKMKKMIARFHHQSSAYESDLKEVIERCSKFIHTTNDILPEQYVIELNAKIDKMLRKRLISDDWHELRKLIKQWIYATNWISEDEETNRGSQFSFYNKLQESIGHWHDLQVIKETIVQKQIHLSAEIDIQKDLSKAMDKLNQAIRYRENHITEMIAKSLAVA